MYSAISLFIAKRNIRWLSLLLADVSLIWGAFAVYSYNAWYRDFIGNEARLALGAIAAFYTIISIIGNISRREDDSATSPGQIFFGTLVQMADNLAATGRERIPVFASPQHKTKFLFVLVKLFFIPLMVQFTAGNIFDMIHEVQRVVKTGMDRTVMMWFNNVCFPLAITAFFLIDTAIFTFGYLFESRRLGNKIRSVEPTWGGWIVALICYPPMNQVLSAIAPQYSNMYAYFDHSITATFIMRFAVALLIGVYAWASVSLGTRGSNLTNRGIVTRGAYRLVRHPAYTGKVAAWWLLLSPVLAENPMAISGMAVWTVIYYLRAITEERHLLSDPEYVDYCSKVKWRFIPGIL
ncbi:MAG: isoprenylcysteine carboxyl methyltransferase [Flavipsychrobacter sp.]|nr:isoprenylcysteine carboxyl methyltransferase [Flavipsychrobacter sp.]